MKEVPITINRLSEIDQAIATGPKGAVCSNPPTPAEIRKIVKTLLDLLNKLNIKEI